MDLKEFLQLSASGIRIEPRSRLPNPQKGVEARTADPLWMLARQWQTGEFQAENTGSALSVSVEYSTHQLETWQADGHRDYINFAAAPLEMQAEQEWTQMDWRNRVRAGKEFERLLREAGEFQKLKEFRQYFLFRAPAKADHLDYATQQFIAFMSGKALDGRPLLEWVEKCLRNAQWQKTIDRLNVWLKSSHLGTQRRQQYELQVERLQAQMAQNPIDPDIAGSDSADFVLLLKTFQDWCRQLNIRLKAQPPKAWRDAQLDYRFGLGNRKTNTPYILAPEYRSGDLDWYSFNATTYLKSDNLTWQKQKPITTTPTPLKIRGTALRWWEFEDGSTHFGKLAVENPDMATVSLIESVLIYGDDWYLVPMPLAMPCLARIDRVIIKNVFGEVFGDQVENAIHPAQVLDPNPLKRWEMFTLASVQDGGHSGIVDSETRGIGWKKEGDNPGKSLLFLPPVLKQWEESEPREEIRFIRDEGANMVWGIEKTVLNDLGRPVRGFDAQRERAERKTQARIRLMKMKRMKMMQQLQNPRLNEMERAQLTAELQELSALIEAEEGRKAGPVAGRAPVYRLATLVPDNWIPFIPTAASQPGSPSSIRLQRAEMVRNEDQYAPESIDALSNILGAAKTGLRLLEEASVPRAGQRVLLTAQRARWIDGETYVWLGRKVLAGRGEGSSGLRFDLIT